MKFSNKVLTVLSITSVFIANNGGVIQAEVEFEERKTLCDCGENTGCDQVGCDEAECEAGGCNQDNAGTAQCGMGNCSQRNTTDPSCDAGSCCWDGDTTGGECAGGDCTDTTSACSTWAAGMYETVDDAAAVPAEVPADTAPAPAPTDTVIDGPGAVADPAPPIDGMEDPLDDRDEVISPSSSTVFPLVGIVVATAAALVVALL
mmetsp:Transcript_50703/g.51579  ORF Transcript_50703/g.51579 Transcript_50703/m.51579 type:complete len:204 (-) Transcript_50703:135-746(-)